MTILMSSHLCRGICIWETPAMVAVAAPMLPNNAFFGGPRKKLKPISELLSTILKIAEKIPPCLEDDTQVTYHDYSLMVSKTVMFP